MNAIKKTKRNGNVNLDLPEIWLNILDKVLKGDMRELSLAKSSIVWFIYDKDKISYCEFIAW